MMTIDVNATYPTDYWDTDMLSGQTHPALSRLSEPAREWAELTHQDRGRVERAMRRWALAGSDHAAIERRVSMMPSLIRLCIMRGRGWPFLDPEAGPEPDLIMPKATAPAGRDAEGRLHKPVSVPLPSGDTLTEQAQPVREQPKRRRSPFAALAEDGDR